MAIVPEGTSTEGISASELRLAARNHALPLEALRHPITPAGLHYLLIHYDIPAVDPSGFVLEIGGAVERPLSLSLDDLRARERVALPVTFECAGNGRALLEPRPVSQPWLTGAVGTAEWAGARSGRCSRRPASCAGRRRGALHRARPWRRGRGGAGLRASAPRQRRRSAACSRTR